MVKKTLVMAATMALGVSAAAFAANPFSDVPSGHWAYASVAKLAAAGIVDGYPAGSFKGERTMTRYEMAQIVAKALAKGAIGEDDKLVAEFSDELNNLGVRVAKLEKNADMVKITGAVRARYFHSRKGSLKDGKSNHVADLRTRIKATGEINDNWHYVGMLQNIQDLTDNNGNGETTFLRAYLDGNLGAVGVRAGRFDHFMANGLVYDDEGNGVEAKIGDKTNLMLDYGKVAIDDDGSKFFAAEAGTKIQNLGIHGGYYRFSGDYSILGEDPNMWNAGLSYDFGKATLRGDYLKGNKANADGKKDGYAFALNVGEADSAKPGSVGFFANYWNQSRGTFYAHTTDANTFSGSLTGFRGYGVGASYTAMKNGVLTLAYYDTKEKGGADREDQRIWTDLTVTF